MCHTQSQWTNANKYIGSLAIVIISPDGQPCGESERPVCRLADWYPQRHKIKKDRKVKIKTPTTSSARSLTWYDVNWVHVCCWWSHWLHSNSICHCVNVVFAADVVYALRCHNGKPNGPTTTATTIHSNLMLSVIVRSKIVFLRFVSLDAISKYW